MQRTEKYPTARLAGGDVDGARRWLADRLRWERRLETLQRRLRVVGDAPVIDAADTDDRYASSVSPPVSRATGR